jgi:hypothetical protein
MNIFTQVPVRQASISAVVIRCQCGDPYQYHPRNADGSLGVCPMGVTTNLGTISYYHQNPIRRLAMQLYIALKDFYFTWRGKK